MSRVLSFGDLHAPFTSWDWLEWLSGVKKKLKPDLCVCVGDLVDNHILSRWMKNPDALSLTAEVEEAKKVLKALEKIFPELVVIKGNHDERLQFRAEEMGIPAWALKDVPTIYDFPSGWDYGHDYYEIDDVYYYHGHLKGGVNPAWNMSREIGKSVVCGHYHSIGGLTIGSPLGSTRFGMNLGCGVDINTYGMYYSKAFLNKVVLGAGFVEDGTHPVYLYFGGK